MSTLLRSVAARAQHTRSVFTYLARVFGIFLAFSVCANAKVFDRCELAQVLHNKHQLDLHEVATWTCIAQHASGFNTEAYAGGPDGGSHGLFHISDVYWCSPPGKGLACNLPCERLRDADLTDDLNCLHIIFDEHQRLSGDGYNAWNAYQQFCRRGVENYIQDCFANQRILPVAQQSAVQASFVSAQAPFYTPTALAVHSNSISSNSYSPHKRGKVYDRCELAQELYYMHKMPMDQIPTWVCIAQHESKFDTSAVGHLNADGSADHGLFQISDLYWCSHDRYGGGKACQLQCTKLLDNDITDDVRCIKRIHGEHARLSGDGFTAWSVYDRDCRNQQYAFISACFKDQTAQYSAKIHVNTLANESPFHTANAYEHQQYQANPFLKHIGALAKPTPTLPLQYQHTSQNTYIPTQHTTQSHKGKVYKRCELAQELYFKHKFAMQDIATWVCIAKHESNYDTSAIGRLNGDSSADHGLFQISDLYWCSHDSYGGKACNIPCEKLLDSDITDDVKCIRIIHEEHTRISGDGFTAWTVYSGNCRNQQIEQVSACFDSNEISKTQQFLSTKQVDDNKPQAVGPALALAKGKIYKECELAQELYYKHRLPLKDIPTWVCIAKHESNFNTAAVGRLNVDGSANHGLFQISDLYWCALVEFGGKACNIPCHKLHDADISDDIECIKTIHAEHTRISGDGFTAWVSYNGHCRNQQLERVTNCFPTDEIRKVQTFETNAVSNRHEASGAPVKGKIYNKCELAQELYFKHKMPMEYVPTWVCIAKHESSFNTAAVGRLNVDGSADHGLFQISDLYWCSHDDTGGKACHISCKKLLDNDITDDVRCVKTIYEEHTRLSGDGFTAWTVYNQNCRNQQVDQISACFDSKELQKAQQVNRFEQSEKPKHMAQVYTNKPLTNVPKKISHPDELNHPFVNNPFLNQYGAVKFVNTMPARKIITAKPATHYNSNEVLPSTIDYINNPFLNKFVQSHSPNYATTSKPITFTNNTPTSKLTPAAYALNPFLNKIQLVDTKIQKSPPSSSKPQKLNYHFNPFLTKYIDQSSNLTLIESTKRQPSAFVALKQQTVAQYQNNPFLPTFSAATHSLNIKSNTRPVQQKPHTTPSSSAVNTKLHIVPTRPYVNSDVFRTTPVKAQASSTNLKPGRDTQALSTTPKSNTQSSPPRYYSNSLSTTTKKPTTLATVIGNPSFAGVTTTKRPSSTASWNWQHRLQVAPTKTALTQSTTSTAKTRTTTSTKASDPPTKNVGQYQRKNITTTPAYKTTTTPLPRKPLVTTTTAKPTIKQITTKTASLSTKRPTTITTRRPSTTPRSPTNQKPTAVARTTTRPTTTTQKTTKHITTTRRPSNKQREPITQKTSVSTKTTQRPTTTTQKTTKRTTTATKPQLQHYISITTRKPTTTVRTPLTQKTVATTKTTTTAKSTNRPYSFKTTKVPYSINKKETSTPPFTQFRIKSPNSTITTSASAIKRTTNTTRLTTRNPIIFATSTANQKPTRISTTTLKPKVTASSTIATTNRYRDDPFSHPFFAKYKEQFKVFESTTTRKPAHSNTKYHQVRAGNGEESEYFQHFRNHTAGNAKTVYAYTFGQNGTLTGHYGK